jgi:hypothetical protein
MLLYEELVKLIEQNRAQISRAVAQELLKQGLITGRLEEVALRYVSGVVAVEEYLKSNVPDQWQVFITNYTQRGLKAGFTLEFLLTIGNLINDNVTLLIEQNFAGEKNQSKRERFLRRMSGMRTFAELTMRNARLNMDDR